MYLMFTTINYNNKHFMNVLC